MKNYNFNKAKQLIAENSENLESASLGMHEDWFWTAETIWENGNYKTELNDETTIGYIAGSSWGTPTLQLSFKDGTEKMIACSEEVIEYIKSYGNTYYLTTKADLKGAGIRMSGDGSDHKRGMKTYHVTDNAFKKLKAKYPVKLNTTSF